MSETQSEKILGPGASGDPDNPGERGNAPAVLSPAEQAKVDGEAPPEVKLPAGDETPTEQKVPTEQPVKGGKPPLGQLPDGQKQD